MKRIAAVAAALVCFSATAASACREGARSLPPEIGTTNEALLARADRIFVASIQDARGSGTRVTAQLMPVRSLRGEGRHIAFEDATLPSTCAPIASARLGSLIQDKEVLVIERDGPDGFYILIDWGGLWLLGARDLMPLLNLEHFG